MKTIVVTGYGIQKDGLEKDVIITDLRGVDPIYSGNRFMIYSMYPEQNMRFRSICCQ